MADFQNSPAIYAQAIQAQLESIFAPTPVYALFNRNQAVQNEFVTWQLRNVHQPVYTGQQQSNKGIDRPVFQISIFSKTMEAGFLLSQTLLDELHGYSGQFGNLFFVAKADVFWLYNGYDDEIGLNQIVCDCTLDIPN